MLVYIITLSKVKSNTYFEKSSRKLFLGGFSNFVRNNYQKHQNSALGLYRSYDLKKAAPRVFGKPRRKMNALYKTNIRAALYHGEIGEI